MTAIEDTVRVLIVSPEDTAAKRKEVEKRFNAHKRTRPFIKANTGTQAVTSSTLCIVVDATSGHP